MTDFVAANGLLIALTILFVILATALGVRRVRRVIGLDFSRAEEAQTQLADEGRRRELLVRLGERALAGGPMDAVSRHVVQTVIEGVHLPHAVVLQSQPEGRMLAVTASAGWEDADGITIEGRADSQVGYALFVSEPIVVTDAPNEPRFTIPADLRSIGAASGVAVRVGAVRPMGVLAAYDVKKRVYTAAEQQFVTAAATILAGAYERHRLEEERIELVARDEIRRVEGQRAARRSAFLAQTATVLDAALDPAMTLVSLARLAVPAIADCAVVDLVEESGEVRRIEVVDIDPIRRSDAEALRRLTVHLRGEGPFPRAIRTGQPVLLPELNRVGGASAADVEQIRLLTRLGCQSLLLIPLVARGQTLGLVTLGSRLPYRYEGADLSLAHEVAGRAAIALDNGRLHREAQAASRAKDEFLAMVSHELRTPLQSVLGWSAILRRHPLDEDRARKALDAIERSVRAQAQLLEQLIDISRIVAGRFELRLGPVRLAEIIDGAVDAVRPTADDRAIRIEKHLDAGLPLVTADHDRMQQVVINLLSNAVKFTADKGLVDVELRVVDATTAEIVVRDQGVGIKPEFLPYVFDRFRQSEGPPGMSNNGLGLGLSIVREIVERHGGSVIAESGGEGQGATFRVVLPLVSSTEVPSLALSRTKSTPSA